MFTYDYEFSVVMGYYNRKKQIINTLNIFEKIYSNYNYEVIIIDDNSDKNHKLNDIIKNYTFNIKYIGITQQEKRDRINPCVPYNIGIKQAKGKYLIIQNPECFHVGNLFEHIKRNLTYNNYISFSCYSANNEKLSNQLVDNINIINDIEFRKENSSIMFEWYNHPQYRPVNYHFCAGIMNDNMKILGGFDEVFSKGHSYDDNELLLSIYHNLKLEIQIVSPNECFVIHQWHSRDAEHKFKKNEINYKLQLNKNLYEKYLIEHKKYNFKFPKLLHLYWDGSLFSYLNLLTIISFNKYHFGWKINVYCPTNPIKIKSWITPEQKTPYNGKDYFNELNKINNVFIHYIDFNNLQFKYNNASEVIKSDYFRLYILNKYGGMWSDFDIIYINNIEKYYSNKKLNNKKFILYTYKEKQLNITTYPVGLFLSEKNNTILNVILNNIHNFYNENNYQCLGASMFYNIFNNKNYHLLNIMKLSELYIDNADCYLKIKWNELDKLYKNKDEMPENFENNENIIGIHWFNGAKQSKDYCNNLDTYIRQNKLQENCLIDKFVKNYYYN